MNEIICPNCSKAFKVDEAGFSAILKQVRNRQFEEEINSKKWTQLKNELEETQSIRPSFLKESTD